MVIFMHAPLPLREVWTNIIMQFDRSCSIAAGYISRLKKVCTWAFSIALSNSFLRRILRFHYLFVTLLLCF